MGFYDLIVLILVGIFAWRGYQKGLVNQVGALITVIVVGSISVFYAPTLSDYMPGSGNVSFAIAFIVVVLLASLVVWNVVNSLSKLVTKFKLKSWNKQMGAFLGLINGIFVAMIVTFCLLVFVVPRPVKNADGTITSVTYDRDHSFILNSFFGPYLKSATLATIDCLPCGRMQLYNNLREKLQDQADKMKSQDEGLSQFGNSTPPNSYNTVNQAPPQGHPGYNPSGHPGYNPSGYPGYNPSGHPGYNPSGYPGYNPSGQPQNDPSGQPRLNRSAPSRFSPSGYPGVSEPSTSNPSPGYNGSPLDGIL